MSDGRRLLLILALLLLSAYAAAPQDTSAGTDEPRAEGQTEEAVKEPDEKCVPPVIVIILFTGYGFFLVYLYGYAGVQWMRLMDARMKLRKLMALELAIIQYDEYCERHNLRGRAETFFPACNIGFFLDQGVQETWVSVNNLRKRLCNVPTSDYAHLNRLNWDMVKRVKTKEDKKRENQEKKLRAKEGTTKDGIPQISVKSLITAMMSAEFFVPSKEEKAEEKAEGIIEGAEQKEEKKASDSIKVLGEKKEKEEKKEEKKEDATQREEKEENEKKEDLTQKEEKKDGQAEKKEKKMEETEDKKKK